MYTVKLENEYLRGAVWVLGEDGITTEGKLPLVENDPMVLEINEEIAEMYDSYLEFDSHDQGCWFNEEQRKADREKMLSPPRNTPRQAGGDQRRLVCCR